MYMDWQRVGGYSSVSIYMSPYQIQIQTIENIKWNSTILKKCYSKKFIRIYEYNNGKVERKSGEVVIINVSCVYI